MNRFARIGETADPYEQLRVMHSAGVSGLVRAESAIEHCA
jgi:hypothetical protein